MTDLNAVKNASAMWREAFTFPRQGEGWPATDYEMDAEILLADFEATGGLRHQPMSQAEQRAAEAVWAAQATQERAQAERRTAELAERTAAELARVADAKARSVARFAAESANPRLTSVEGIARYLGAGFYGLKTGRKDLVLLGVASSVKGSRVRVALNNGFVESFEVIQ